MQYRWLLPTMPQVSVLGFGASPLGGVFGNVDETEAIATVHAAMDQGVNFFDVSPYYGLTKAETVLGRALKTAPRDEYLLATKVGRYGNTDFDFSAERVTRSVEESLKRLQVDHIDLIQCHDIEFGSLDQIVAETLPTLYQLRETGKVKYVGISGLPLKIFPSVLDRAQSDTILSYCHYSLLDDTLATLLPYFKAKGVGVINASPFAMGLLTDNAPPAWHPAPEAMQIAAANAARFCRERGNDLSQLALQWALTNRDISTTLVGMSTREQLTKNLACIGQRPDVELLSQVQALLQPVHNQTWPSGRPENNA